MLKDGIMLTAALSVPGVRVEFIAVDQLIPQNFKEGQAGSKAILLKRKLKSTVSVSIDNT
jgi:hypothetical protein